LIKLSASEKKNSVEKDSCGVQMLVAGWPKWE